MFPVFENSYLLQAIGWAVLHSFWQVSLLYIVYQSIHKLTPNYPGAIKYNLLTSFVLVAFAWFGITIVRNYFSMVDGSFLNDVFIGKTIKVDLLKLSTVLPFVSLAYFTTLAFYLVFLVRNFYGAHRLRSEGLSKAPFDIRLFTNATALHLGIEKKVQVWVSEKVDVPSVIGFLKPMILLPAAAFSNLSISQTEAIILHELAHIKRNDYLQNLLISLVQAILFFNPFMHLLIKALKNERENCCDDWVMTYGYDAGNYARALLSLEENRHTNLAFALAATSNKKLLLNRIKRLFAVDTNILSTNKQRGLLYAIATLFLLIAVNAVPLLQQSDNMETAFVQGSIKRSFDVVPVSYHPSAQIEIPASVQLRNEPAEPIAIKDNEQAIVSIKKKVVAKKAIIKSPVLEIQLTQAIVNEDILKAKTSAEVMLQNVAEKESDEKKYFIKVEEAQSGNKSTSTYYLQIDNGEGTPAITPLLILNKSVLTLTDSLRKEVKKAALEVKKKVRVTS